MTEGSALTGILNHGTQFDGITNLLGHLGGNEGVGSTSGGNGVLVHPLDGLSDLTRRGDVEGSVGVSVEELLLLLFGGRGIGEESSIHSVLLEEADKHLEPPVHVLGCVFTRKDNNGDTQLDVPQHLPAQVQEVGEVRDRTNERRGSADIHFTGNFVSQELVIQPPLDGIGLEGFLNFSDTVLLQEIESLVSNQLMREFGQQFGFDGSNTLTVVFLGLEGLDVFKDALNFLVGSQTDGTWNK